MRQSAVRAASARTNTIERMFIPRREHNARKERMMKLAITLAALACAGCQSAAAAPITPASKEAAPPQLAESHTSKPPDDERPVAGRLHGLKRSWFNDGKIEEITCYEMGEPAGTWRQYYYTGQIKDERTFSATTPACVNATKEAPADERQSRHGEP
jgi:hypothetical protein